jgi:hypothetical protein
MTEGRRSLSVLGESNTRDHLSGEIGLLERGAIEMLLDFPRSYVVSAQAYLLAQHMTDGMAVAEVANLAGMSIELTHEALDELDGRAMITRRQDGLVITKAICRRYVDAHVLRYDFR